MRRKRAILLFGSLTLSILAYCTWCGRCFYLNPPLELQEGMPKGIASACRDWRSSSDQIQPIDFSWKVFGERLMKPFSDPATVRIIWSPGPQGEKIYLLFLTSHSKHLPAGSLNATVWAVIPEKDNPDAYKVISSNK